MYTHQQNILTSGMPLHAASKALILLHGRGSNAADIAGLNTHFKLTDTAIFAPQANNNSWYPYSFMAPAEQNQPALDSALEVIKNLVDELLTQGILLDQIYLAGFSQGACLTLEYAARHAAPYGGIIAFTGGLAGQNLNHSNYSGDFGKSPVLITTGDPDPHVPLSRVEESKEILEQLQADVHLKVYKGRVHTISRDEIELARKLIFKQNT